MCAFLFLQGSFTADEDQGNFQLTDQVTLRTEHQTIEDVAVGPNGGLVVVGRLSTADGSESWPYRLEISEETGRRLGLRALVGVDGKAPGVTHVSLHYTASPSEKVFGFGAQYSYLDLKGKRVPVWVSEQGVRVATPFLWRMKNNAGMLEADRYRVLVARAGGTGAGTLDLLAQHQQPRSWG